MAEQAPSFHIEPVREPRRLVLQVSGVIDENADLTVLAAAHGAEICLHLGAVHRINSFGVRAWVEAIRNIPLASRLILSHCSPPVIDQCNMVAGFNGHGVIESFYAPMLCEQCDEYAHVLYDTMVCLANGGVLPTTPCPTCHGSMDIDDLEEQYLTFLRDPETLP